LVLRSSNVQEGEISLLDNVYVKREVATSPNVKVGDIIVVVRNGSRTLIGKHAQINETMPNTVIGAFMAGIHTDEPGFMNVLLSTSRFDDEVNKNLGATINQITNGTFRSMKFLFPSREEQKAIGSYFQHLDSLIQSTTKKIESLKQVKAASLQSMFPQEGETTPRVRFKGFEGEWEKVRASDIFKTYNEKNRPDLPVLSATQDKGMVTREALGYNIFHDKSNEATYKHILPGQFVIHLRSFQGGFAHSAIEGIASPAYTIMDFKDKSRHYDLFWKYIFMSKEFIKRLELITYGIRDGRSISFDEFSEMYFTVPSFNEQKAIASYFTSLDTQITLQSQRLEKLKQIKSACLDNMFV
jgi:type I restriction enzyme S subunit